MFNVVEKHQKVVKGIMIVIASTFVVWGVSGYFGMGGDDGYVAKVGSNKIYSQDIDRAMDQSQGQQPDKMQVLFGLINRQLLLNSFDDHHLSVTTMQLQDAIAAIPAFQTDGKFDINKYQEFLKQRYTTSAKFEQDMQQQILINQELDFFKNSYFTAQTFQDKFAALLSRERNVSRYVIDPKQFYAKISISESDIAAYYQQNIAKYTVAEQVKLQYIQLSADNIAKTIKVSDADVTKYLQDHPNASNNDQIDVSHILFTVATDATAAQKAQVKAQAEKVLAQVKANPADFAKLAKQYSQDPGSATNGGDLGFFGRGVMAKPFEDVAFSMKKGQISDLVETQYGFHILKLNDIKGNDATSKRALVVQQLQKQKAQQQLPAMIDQLNDLTYNKADSLEPAAQKLGINIQNSDWVSKGAAATGLFANPKLQKTIFSDEVLKQHHNSEVVDLGDGSYVVARSTEFKPATMTALQTVKSQIIDALKAQQASQMASGLGQQDLAQLQQGKLKLNFANPENVTLLGQSKTVDPMAVKQIFAAPANFPSYTGALAQDGSYVLYQINSQATDKGLDAQNEKVVSQLAEQYSMMNLNAYVGSLRSLYKVNYKLDRVQNTGGDAAPVQANQ